MKRLSVLLFGFMMMFLSIPFVSAASSSIGNKNSDGTYTFTWNGIDDYYEQETYKYKFSLEGASLINPGDTQGGCINKASGSFKIQANSSNVTMIVTIYKDDTGKPTLTRAEKTIGSTTPQKKEESTTAQTTTEAPKSSDNTLKGLTIITSQGENVALSPTFSKDVYIYEASVEGTVKTVTINAIPNDSKANVVLSSNADEELVSGENNKIVITVTAENGDKKTYTVNIEREALTGDATLKSLTIKESKKFKLTEDKFAYTVKVSKKVKKLTLEYETNDEKANVEVKGNKDLKDGSKVKVIVTAEDGTKKEYTLTISKQEETKIDKTKIDAERNPLIIMGLSIVAFGLIGAIVYVIKK